MKPVASSPDTERDALKRAAAAPAAQLVENDMVVGLGSGSTAAFAVEALERRQRQGLRFVSIPTSECTAGNAEASSHGSRGCRWTLCLGRKRPIKERAS